MVFFVLSGIMLFVRCVCIFNKGSS